MKGKGKGKSKGKSKEKEIKPGEIEFDWEKKHVPYAKEECSLKADIIHQFSEHHIPFDVLSAVTNLDGLVKLLVDESNLYTQQNGREFHTNEQNEHFRNQLPTIKNYWEYGQFIGNEGIRNAMAGSIFEDILQNLHFSHNTKDDKNEKGYKVRSLINHFN